MKFFKHISILILSLSILIFPYLKNPPEARALTFNPNFGVLPSAITPGANSNIQWSMAFGAGSEVNTTTLFNIPAGVGMASGTSFSNNFQIGSGTFTADFGAGQQTIPFVILNKTDLQGHKMRLVADFSPIPITIDVFLDGSDASGHTFRVNSPAISFSPPTILTFSLLGAPGGIPLVTLPSLAGEYTFSAEFTSISGAVVTRVLKINLPAITPSGSNITNNFVGGIAVSFDRVVGTGGLTTVSSSSNPPAAGTGQFQLGGLYYDFNTTANIKCPCTVTMPYDPAITPSPRIYHLESGVWTDVTTSVNTVNHTVTGVVSSFSFFAVGDPNFSVLWEKQIEKRIEKEGNPFELKENKNLGLQFNLLDPSGQIATPENVTVEIWQTKDEAGNGITPVQAVTFDVDLKKKDDYRAKLKAKKAEFVLGTYEIRVLVGNTTASQSPTAGFELVGK